VAEDPRFTRELERLRKEHHRWYRETRDLGLIPESLLHERSQGRTPYAVGKDDRLANGLNLRLAVDKIRPNVGLEELLKLHADEDAAIRWWGVTAIGVLGFNDALKPLQASLKDRSTTVRVAAALALHQIGEEAGVLDTLKAGLKDANPWVRHSAALALDEMGMKAAPALEAIKAAQSDSNEYVVRVVQSILNRLESKEEKEPKKDAKK
jgi:HEAT repeat protein